MPYNDQPKWKAASKKKKPKKKDAWQLEKERNAQEKALRNAELDKLIDDLDRIVKDDQTRKLPRRYHEGELEKFQAARHALWAIRGYYAKRLR